MGRRSRRRAAWRRLLYRRIPRRLTRPLFIIVTMQLVGTIGYPLIEGLDRWTLFDGAYMTTITLSTIGYGEIPYPLSHAGRAFTMLLAYCGIFTIGYSVTEVVRMVVSGELHDLLGKERMEEELVRMHDHLIICGYGRMGKITADELERQKKQFVVIDNGATPPEWPYHHGIRLPGDATEDEILRKAGVERARSLISVVGSDADNLYISLSARLLNPKIFIVARAEEEEAEGKLRRVGANKVISPYLAGAYRAVQAVLRPTVLHFMEMATRPEFLDLQIEEVKVDPKSRFVGQTLRDSGIGRDLGVIVVCYATDGDFQYGPRGDTVIEPDTVLVVLGRKRQLEELEKIASGS